MCCPSSSFRWSRQASALANRASPTSSGACQDALLGHGAVGRTVAACQRRRLAMPPPVGRGVRGWPPPRGRDPLARCARGGRCAAQGGSHAGLPRKAPRLEGSAGSGPSCSLTSGATGEPRCGENGLLLVVEEEQANGAIGRHVALGLSESVHESAFSATLEHADSLARSSSALTVPIRTDTFATIANCVQTDWTAPHEFVAGLNESDGYVAKHPRYLRSTCPRQPKCLAPSRTRSQMPITTSAHHIYDSHEVGERCGHLWGAEQ